MKKLGLTTALPLVFLTVAALSACIAIQHHSQKQEDALIIEAALETVTPADTLAGNYLAGRFAQKRQDWDAAQFYMGAVASLDTDNAALEQRVFLLSIGAGEFEQAKALGEKIIATQSDESEIALIFLACEALSRDDFKTAIDITAKLPDDGFGEYTKPILTAWALAGQGKKEEAVAYLRDNADPTDPTYNVHAGLIQEMAGDDVAAEAYYKTAVKNGLSLHTAILVADFYKRRNQPAMAEKIMSGIDQMYSTSPFVDAEGAAHGAKNVYRAADGAAIALFDLASLLYERRAYDSAQIYGSMVSMLMPSSPFIKLMMGDLAALNEQFDKAVAIYGGIKEDSPLFWLSRMRIAEVYEAAGEPQNAVDLLTELSDVSSTRLQALVSLGDLHRRNERFDMAVRAYDQALDGVTKLTPEHWSIIYARGMSLERNNDWSRAEKDLLTALSFQPNNPMVLNYIGYSWLEKGVNLDKALDFTRRAAALRPDDGYIVDSYGWALYRTGNHTQAVDWLERAVSLIPDESTLLDHLGDAYWQVGRKNEARFKWRRAAEVSTDKTFKADVQRKVSFGIETVEPVKHAAAEPTGSF